MYVFLCSANLGADAARTKFTEHSGKLENELDTQLRLVEKLESEVAAKRELCDVARLSMIHELKLFLCLPPIVLLQFEN